MLGLRIRLRKWKYGPVLNGPVCFVNVVGLVSFKVRET